MRFFKKIQDWILKSERIQKRILCISIKQTNPRSLESWCVKGTEESISRVDSSIPLTHHDPRDLGLICVIEIHKIRFRTLSDLRIQSWIFLKKRTLKQPEKNPGLKGIRTHDLCYTGAMLYQLSCQGNWELATLRVRNTPTDGEECK